MSESVPSTDIAGRTVVLQYSDPATEYNALRHGAAIVDRSHRHRLAMQGIGAGDALNGLVTNDIQSLVPGRGLYCAALSAKGRIVADLRVLRRPDGNFLVDCPPRAAAGWLGIVHKYINPRTAKYADVTEDVRDIGVFGPRALDTLSRVLTFDPEVLRAMEPLAIVETDWRGEGITITSVPWAGAAGFELFAPPSLAAELARALQNGGCTRAGLAAWEISRIESGIPEWGLDMDDTTLAQEANLDHMHAISYTKGCYTGQETVARVHFRGHVNRHLRGLRFVSVDVPPPLSQVFGEGDKPLGEVRSSAYSPRQGGVAIAMIRREAPPGSSVTIRWDGAECQAGVYEIPLEHGGA